MSTQIDYKLALELKNAGFPQHEDGSSICYGIGCYEDAHKISLSELIEECGDDFGSLTRYITESFSGWIASDSPCSDCYPEHNRGIGSTTEEAVSRLWLELNKK